MLVSVCLQVPINRLSYCDIVLSVMLTTLFLEPCILAVMLPLQTMRGRVDLVHMHLTEVKQCMDLRVPLSTRMVDQSIRL
jgi:hypothetical protein